ncbi:MAG: hypothetical protein A3E82_03050 [Gammaproteobacteria bacterium RIFCSPHIGHO2_12_FULL_38_11]|nr:MAG: hypothetical protein A3E82_03050 [Gammaproteobacteria bacterium RIFCSPHIGHO2_12_FULL_38_11]
MYPSLDDVAKAISKNADSKIQVSGAKALHLLGLTTQVPAQTVYLTDGQSKNIQIGQTILTLKHASSKVMAGAGSKAGVVLQAIRHLGKNHINDRIFDQLSQQLNRHDKQMLRRIVRFAPYWTKPALDKLLAA